MKTTLPSFLYSGNAAYIEALYETYLDNPAALDADWRGYFDRLQTEIARSNGDARHDQIQDRLRQAAVHRHSAPPAGAGVSDAHARKQVAVLQLINAYRFRGHSQADLDPLHQYERPQVADLDPAFHGLGTDDMDTVFNTGSFQGDGTEMKLKDLVAALKKTYCGSIGAEYMHINDTPQKRWIQQRLEANAAATAFSTEKKRQILERLIAAQALEEYLHTKYVGQKRFSLEGGETLIPLLDELIQGGGSAGIKEIVIGMAHRGRLNVLVNIVGKMPSELMQEFEGKKKAGGGSGDVKYHMGYSSDIDSPGGPVHLTLSFNPSHLEIISPVVEGSVRARQDRRRDSARSQVLPILIHGDAAFAGQGVVMETFNFSQTRGYSTGGTVHIIVNNQIGFTTSDPLDSRSTLYCTDVAKTVQAPIFHVNADNPEAVLRLAQLALDYRMTFKKDVVIDLVCFRKHGHNESDEPMATQPIMYQRIRQHPGLVRLYSDRLQKEAVIGADDPARIRQQYVQMLEENQPVSRSPICNLDKSFTVNFDPYKSGHWWTLVDTTLPLPKAQHLAGRFTTCPENFKLHKSVTKIMEARREMAAGNQPMDWGFAETLAYASLVDEDYPVRLSGQDSGRGTFFHRHAVLHHQETGETFLPLRNIREGQAQFLVINSTLSEMAVLGFEYGFSSSEPGALVIWEAQFGDFANCAQVVIDQFIASCEAKWGRLCGLTLFLPHGYDGQGPEHSSARLERFLQLCAEDNMQVCVPSTPAQMFHLLRRQMLRPYRRPLVVMTPKSLLRHKLSVSTLADITDRSYQMVLKEIDPIQPSKVDRILVCSGKVYFDLLEARRANGIDDIAILRIEQLYPFPRNDLRAAIESYPNAREVVWVQEEPHNQGACAFLLESLNLFSCLHAPQNMIIVARPHSAAPAVGSLALHQEQQKTIVSDALRLQDRTAQKKKTA
ncbi:MAG TPA: 2-oxoglutarate dehydrogenase E1 component [Gammaproteobacteria bacterium]|nr:2-oxoglutarate dehydrogenase E1 component [Gammaproteobacteria bacterium]